MTLNLPGYGFTFALMLALLHSVAQAVPGADAGSIAVNKNRVEIEAGILKRSISLNHYHPVFNPTASTGYDYC
jgi:hypothetical protein